MKKHYFIVLLFISLIGCKLLDFEGKLDVLSPITLSYKKKELILSPSTYEVKADIFSKKEQGKENNYLQIKLLKYKNGSINLDPIKLAENKSVTTIHGKNYIVNSNIESRTSSGGEYSTTVSCTYSDYVYRCDRENSFNHGHGCQEETDPFEDRNETELCRRNLFREDTCEHVYETIRGTQSAIAKKTTTYRTLRVDFASSSSGEVMAKLSASYSSSSTRILRKTGSCN